MFEISVDYYYYFNQETTSGGSNITKDIKRLFGGAPYSGQSSSIKPSCSRVELNRFTATFYYCY